LDPEYAGSYYNLGFVYFHMDQVDSTEYYFLRFAEKLKRDTAFIWSDLGFVAALLHKDQEALSYFNKAVSIDPEFPGTYLNLGDYQFEKGRLEEAEEVYLKYLQLVPDRNTVHYNLAAVLALKGELEKALDRLEIAIDKGFDKEEKLKKDDHFKSLRQLPRFQELLQRIARE